MADEKNRRTESQKTTKKKLADRLFGGSLRIAADDVYSRDRSIDDAVDAAVNGDDLTIRKKKPKK